MFATDILRKEHHVILKMLDATDAAGRRLILGGQVSPDTLTGLLEQPCNTDGLTPRGLTPEARVIT